MVRYHLYRGPAQQALARRWRLRFGLAGTRPRWSSGSSDVLTIGAVAILLAGAPLRRGDGPPARSAEQCFPPWIGRAPPQITSPTCTSARAPPHTRVSLHSEMVPARVRRASPGGADDLYSTLGERGGTATSGHRARGARPIRAGPGCRGADEVADTTGGSALFSAVADAAANMVTRRRVTREGCPYADQGRPNSIGTRSAGRTGRAVCYRPA